jgi:hypothetical protein
VKERITREQVTHLRIRSHNERLALQTERINRLAQNSRVENARKVAMTSLNGRSKRLFDSHIYCNSKVFARETELISLTEGPKFRTIQN